MTARHAPLYLHATSNPDDVFHSGSLLDAPSPSTSPASYRYDPLDVSLAALESSVDDASLVDQRMLHARHGRQLVYHSAPFVAATEISGFFELTLWLAIDQPDTDVAVSVHEVALDGSSLLLASDTLRARYREGPRLEQLITTTTPLRYRFQRFMFVARRVAAGHRLRLVVGPLHSIYWQKNYNSGGAVSAETAADARPVRVQLFQDPERPSVLHVPLGQVEIKDV